MGGFVSGLFGGGGPSQPNVQVYQPSGTASQDTNLQNLLSQAYGNLYGSSNPYTSTLPQAQSIYGSLYNSPYASAYQTAAGNAGTGYANTGNAALMNSTALSGGIPQLMAGANQVYQTGLDPQQALYNQQLQQATDMGNVTNAQYGLTGQQAAGNQQQNLNNFNIDWQNNELSRQIAGLGGAAGAMGAAGSLGTTAAGLGGTGAGQLTTGGATPYGASASIAGQQQNALQAYIAQLLGPTTSAANTIGQQQNYLNTGVNASAQGANAAYNDYMAQLQNSANIGSGIGDILGLGTNSGGTVGSSLFSSLGNLFGSSGGGKPPLKLNFYWTQEQLSMPLNLGAFLGGNNGQGGLMPQIQAAQKAAQERALQAAAWQAMQAGLIPQNAGSTPPMPNQTPMPQQLPPTSGMPPVPQQGGYPPMPPPPGNGAPANLDQLLQQYNTNPQIPPAGRGGMQPPAPGSTDPIVRQALGNPQQQYPPMPQQPKAPPAPPSIDDIAKAAPPDMMTQFMTGLTKANMPDWKKGAVMSQFMQSYGQIAQRQEQARHDAAMEDIGRMNAGAHQEIAGADVTKANNSKATGGVTLSDTSLDELATAFNKTNKLPAGMGWGASANANKIAIINRASELDPGADLAGAGADYAGTVSGSRALGTAGNKIILAANSLDQAIPLARTAIKKLDLTNYPSVNAIENAVRKGTGDPNIVAANTAIQTVISDYSGLIARTGQQTEGTREIAKSLANTDMSIPQLNAVFDQIEKEKAAQLRAVSMSKKDAASQGGADSPQGGNVVLWDDLK